VDEDVSLTQDKHKDYPIGGKKAAGCKMKGSGESIEQIEHLNLIGDEDLAIHRLTQKLAVAENFDRALRLSLETATRSAGMDTGGIYLSDPLDKNLRLACVTGISSKCVADAEVLKPYSRAWRFVTQKQPSYCSLSTNTVIPLQIRKLCIGENLRSIALMPLIHRKVFMGALFVSSRKIKKIPRHARSMLEIVAAQSSASLFRLRQDETIKRQEGEVACLNRLAASLSKPLSLNQIFQRAFHEIKGLNFFGPGCGVRIFLTEAQTGNLLLAYHDGPCGDHPCNTNPLPVGECLCGLAARSCRLVVSKKGHDEGPRRGWRERFPHNDICVPLKARNKVLGVINVYLPLSHNLPARNDGYRSLTSICKLISIAIDNRRLLEEVEEHRERSLSLALGTIEAKEAERKRLAQELHDQVGSSLTALSINLNALRIQTYAVMDELAASKLNNSIAIVKKTAEFVRNEVTNLRPPSLDTSRFVAALQHYVESFKSWADISVEISCKKDISTLPAFKGITLFRIVQEALLNIAKHSKAKQARVEIGGDSEKLSIVISDDGVGFDVATYINNPKSNHFGLMIMAERAKTINGLYRLTSSPGEGTTVLVEVPH
jgi:signal transduction histidine kinase